MSKLLERETLPFHSNGVRVELKLPPLAEPVVPPEQGELEGDPGPAPDERSALNAGNAAGRTSGRMPAVLAAAGLLLALAVGTWAARAWQFASTRVGTDDAYVTTDIVQITPQVSGKVSEVRVADNQAVKKGQLLAVIDDATFRADADQARANLQVAEAAAQGAAFTVGLTDETGRAQIEQAQGGLADTESGIGAARANVSRMQAGITDALAVAGGARANVTNARSVVEAAVAGRSHADQTVRATQAQLNSAETGVETAQSGVRSAQAALDTAVAVRNRTAQTVKSAQAGVDAAQTGIRNAQAGMDAAQGTAQRATRDEGRFDRLFKSSAVSAQAADQARDAGRTARAQLTAAEGKVQQSKATLEQREADLAADRDAISAADAQVRQAEAGLTSAQQGVEQARTVVLQRHAELDAARDGVRTADAQTRQATSLVTAQQEAVHAAEAAVLEARAQWTSAVQNVGVAHAKRQQAEGTLQQARTQPQQVRVSTANLRTSQAKVAQAHAVLENAEIALARTRIYAPMDGTVTRKTVQVGQQLAPGQALMMLMPANDLWVVANYKETQLRNVRPGQKAEIEVDTFAGRSFHGIVDSLAPNTGAEVTLLPPDNSTGNFTKVVQRVPVKVMFQPEQPGLELLRSGLSVVVNIRVR